MQSCSTRKTLCGKDAAAALQRSRLIVVPCESDGVEIQIHGAESAGEYTNLVKEVSKGDTTHWQSNARGVDINHNFNAYWHKLQQMEVEDGITGPAMTRYGGTYPESEPESKYLADLTRKCEFEYALAFHSQGKEIYYGFDDYLLPIQNTWPKTCRIKRVFIIKTGRIGILRRI